VASKKERKNCKCLGHLNFENPWVVRDLVECELHKYKILHSVRILRDVGLLMCLSMFKKVPCQDLLEPNIWRVLWVDYFLQVSSFKYWKTSPTFKAFKDLEYLFGCIRVIRKVT